MKDTLLKDYNTELNYDGIDGKRLAERLDAISKIGVLQTGGVSRPGFSQEEKDAKALVTEWMNDAGLTVETDAVGNVFGRLTGKDNSQSVASGSHVDTVPAGGNFDGVLGVLAALEVAEAWKETGYIPDKSYEIIIFSDEEGARFSSGVFGSRAYMGLVDDELIESLRDSDGLNFEEVLEQYGSSLQDFKKIQQRDWTFFAEAHIEQGKLLEKNNLPVGIVNGIAGQAWLEIEFKGLAGHAGNTPMNDRQDALVAAGRFVSELESIPKIVSSTAVATVGKLAVYPNGANVIPESVKMIVDIRDIHEKSRDMLLELISERAYDIAKERGIDVTVSRTSRVKPVPVEETYKDELRDILTDLNIEAMELPSGAGHDSMNIGLELPVAMIFARSKAGISHNPAEWTSLDDCVLTVHVLKKFIEKQMSK
ncbi:Zn-dependent hydrolase [Jeotgalicoccus coquinae]|uniref:Allantoate deiminase n=1 Tax=Jeotgalicoccus coquinae TaxID=709509 RepID=A0A6V7R370_9STAP|nr:M20 family metallo-hydrolase [Jeotgalicoccus coquinae]MBB6423551.1 allantoate deiminase [Jeotgalicoccus coquinae]GGE20736.1 Zn-dependent hydrolase [Jeotgalicoccus coquinae]CAD2071473.1 N-carbamoyl-L-amino acid hydrolase [Jeotgalicoccus coquinae]